MGESTAKVKKNSIYNLIKTVSTIVFPLITFPYISRVLLPDNVGKINFGSSIISYISLLASLGISVYAIREESKVKDDKKKLEELGSQIYSLNILSTIIAYAVLAALLIFARKLEGYRTLIIIQSAAVLFTTLGADWINTALEDFKYITIRTFSFQLLALLLMFIFVHHPEDYLKYAIISVISSSGGNIANIIYRRKFCRLHFTWHIEIAKHIKPILFLFAMQLSQQIYVNSDTTILGLIRGDYEVGLYSVSVKIYNIVNMMVASITYVVIPGVSYSAAHGDYKKANELLRYALNYVVTLGVPVIVGILAMTSDLVYVVSGADYSGAATSLRILMIALAASYIGGFFGNMILIPTGQEKVTLFSSIGAAIINLVTNIIFIPIWGKDAAAATTAAAEIISLIILTRFIPKWVKIERIKNIIFPAITGSAAFAAVIIIALRFMTGMNVYLRTVILIVISAVIYFVIQAAFHNEMAVDIIRGMKRRLHIGKE